MKIDVLYQFDDGYAPFGGTSMVSLFENNKHFDEINVYVLDNAVSENNIQKLNQMAEKYNRTIIYLDTAELVKLMEETGIPKYRGSYSTNMKMFVSLVIPEKVEKLLYIDSDTLVVGRLDEIAGMDMSDKPLAMTIDSIARGHKKHIGFQKTDAYHNAGVMLFHIPNWKKMRCTERIIEHVKNVRAHYLAPDQDLINIVMKNDIITISPRYDLQPLHVAFDSKTYFRFFSGKGYYDRKVIEEAKKSPVIYHFFRFMGEFPWHKDNVHPYGKVFDEYLNLSPWKDYEKKPAGGGFVFAIEKWMYRYLPSGLFLFIFKVNYEYFMYRANKMSLKNKNHESM